MCALPFTWFRRASSMDCGQSAANARQHRRLVCTCMRGLAAPRQLDACSRPTWSNWATMDWARSSGSLPSAIISSRAGARGRAVCAHVGAGSACVRARGMQNEGRVDHGIAPAPCALITGPCRLQEAAGCSRRCRTRPRSPLTLHQAVCRRGRAGRGERGAACVGRACPGALVRVRMRVHAHAHPPPMTVWR